MGKPVVIGLDIVTNVLPLHGVDARMAAMATKVTAHRMTVRAARSTNTKGAPRGAPFATVS
jgi:hypothetical protein